MIRRARRRPAPPPELADTPLPPPSAAPYVDPLPQLGRSLPPELLRDLMSLPPLMRASEAARQVGMTVDRMRALVRSGEIAGVAGGRAGAARMLVSRSGLIAWLERRYRPTGDVEV